ncbi:hypothetical protein LCGC14_1822180 [marine sediment metagenome]|uniref:DUF551 domain-containing protein n=1 Tax=marine sediment metagenome TaxID=412755 RepID=A0A0F9H6P9_9ZZZZ
MTEETKIHLQQFVDFLLKEGYCDTDVYAEPPTAIDQYMAKHPTPQYTLQDVSKGWISVEDALPRKSGKVRFKSLASCGETKYQIIGSMFIYDVECSANSSIAGIGTPDKITHWMPPSRGERRRE